VNCKPSHLLFLSLLVWAAVGIQGAEITAETPPPIPSPIEDFRQLLRANAEVREELLTGWPEPKRQILRRKCDLYDRLPDSERERRLRMLELRWYLQPLMTNRTDRTAALNGVPPEFHKIVAERLRQWDSLPPTAQKQLIDNDMALQYFARPQQTSRERPQDMSARERRRLSHAFNTFFELPPAEQEKTLDSLSESERKEMEKTLEAFSKLPMDQRRVSIASFQRLAEMSPTERAEFFRNAERWQKMSPKEREQWRSIVKNLPPVPPDSMLPPVPPRTVPPGSNTVGN
jgi:hypothetical protein